VASFSRISPPRSSSEAAISSAYGERWPGGKNMGKTMEKPMENGGFYGGWMVVECWLMLTNMLFLFMSIRMLNVNVSSILHGHEMRLSKVIFMAFWL
jgi:hypothetical protein